MAENPSLIKFLDSTSQQRGDELAKISITMLNIANVGGEDGVDKVLDDLVTLRTYTDMMCKMKNIPFDSEMLTNGHWKRVQGILKVWVQYVKIEFKELLVPVTDKERDELANGMGVKIVDKLTGIVNDIDNIDLNQEKDEELPLGYHSDGDCDSTSSDDDIHSV